MHAQYLLMKTDTAADFIKLYGMAKACYAVPGFVFIDKNHIKANANTKKNIKKRKRYFLTVEFYPPPISAHKQ